MVGSADASSGGPFEMALTHGRSSVPGQTFSVHAGPPQPEAHAHWPWKQRPFPEHPDGHPLTEQLGPWYGALQKHLPSMHLPWPEQSLSAPAHVGVAQSSPDQPASHAHVLPSTHAPWCEQRAGHVWLAHVGPDAPAAHAHVGGPPDGLWTQRPRNEQSSAQRRSSQFRPVNAPRQRHCASMHTPRPEQSPVHAAVAQSSPPHPASHTQREVPPSTAHLPWPEHAFGQSARAQSAPAQPGRHEHLPVRVSQYPRFSAAPQSAAHTRPQQSFGAARSHGLSGP
jgi:hypothetical protein